MTSLRAPARRRIAPAGGRRAWGATAFALAVALAPVAAPAANASVTGRATSTPLTTTLPADVRGASWSDPAGTTSTYHLFTAGIAPEGPAGLVVYLDGDGMYGHDHPTSSWALGGTRGIVAQARARGFATLSIRTPDRRGTPTFWEDGAVNAAYVASLTGATASRLRTNTVWFVGYSGGAQLVTKFLLPRYGASFGAGGAVIAGGGGAPSSRGATMPLPATYPLFWYTGSADDGSTSDDGYDALADARRGHAWYLARGAAATLAVPAGLDHEDLGGRFGAVLAGRLDATRR